MSKMRCSMWSARISRRAALGDDPPAVDERQPIAVRRLVHVVRGDEQRHAAAGQVVEQVPELAPRHRVDAGGGLVEEQQLRLVDRRSAQRQPLPPADGEVAGEFVLASHQVGHVQHVLALGRRTSPAAGRRPRRRTSGSRRPSCPRTARTSGTCSRSAAAPGRGGAPRPRRAPARCPDFGRRVPVSIRIVVVLPDPFGPRKPKTSPRGTSKSMPSTAVKSPKVLVRPRTEMAGPS